MIRQTCALALSSVVVAACSDDPPSFADAAAGPDAAGDVDAAANLDAANLDAAVVPIAPDGIAGMEVWLDGSRGVTATAWADQSANNRGVTCTVGGFTAGTLNGHPAAHATGSNCRLMTNVPVFQPDEGVLVAVAASIINGGGLIAIDGTVTNSNLEIAAGNLAFGEVGNVDVYAAGQVSHGVPHVFVLYRKHGLVTIRVDGVPGDTHGAPAPSPVVGGYVMWAPFTFTEGDLGEILVYRGDVGDAQIAGLEAYLLAKYRP